MNKLTWKNLEDDCCPKCGNALVIEPDNDRVRCLTEHEAFERGDKYATCFIMAKKEYYRLKTDISDRKALSRFDHDNTEALNNL